MPNFPPNQPGNVTIFRTIPLALPQTGVKTIFSFFQATGPGTGRELEMPQAFRVDNHYVTIPDG